MTNDKIDKKYDLAERTERFGEAVVVFSKKIPVNATTQRIIPQLVASGTAIGSNYCEADDAESGKDFSHKIGICKKEARETKYWFKIAIAAAPEIEKEAKILWQEAKELHLIFNSIRKKVLTKIKEI